MYTTQDTEHQCPLQDSKTLLKIQDALECLQGKWKLPIIAALLTGPKRFKELSVALHTITDRMLSKELKTMESQLLVNKLKKSRFSIEMEYGLTDHGKSLQSLIENLIDWGDQHRDLVIDKWREESTV